MGDGKVKTEIREKIKSAKKSNWIVDGISEAEAKSLVELAKISAQIERKRLDLGMTQKEFAEFMEVSQGMVSKWESRDYNFTIRSLNEICHKLDLSMSVNIDKACLRNDYKVLKWDSERTTHKQKKNWINNINSEGAIA